MYNVFVRDWWRYDAAGRLVPNPGARKYTIERGLASESEAREIAQEYNRTHSPGLLSRKAEYTET